MVGSSDEWRKSYTASMVSVSLKVDSIMVRSEKRMRMRTEEKVRLRDEWRPRRASSLSRSARVRSGASGPLRCSRVERKAALSSSGVAFRSSSAAGGGMIEGDDEEEAEGGRNTRTPLAEGDEPEPEAVEACSCDEAIVVGNFDRCCVAVLVMIVCQG